MEMEKRLFFVLYLYYLHIVALVNRLWLEHYIYFKYEMYQVKEGEEMGCLEVEDLDLKGDRITGT